MKTLDYSINLIMKKLKNILQSVFCVGKAQSASEAQAKLPARYLLVCMCKHTFSRQNYNKNTKFCIKYFMKCHSSYMYR